MITYRCIFRDSGQPAAECQASCSAGWEWLDYSIKNLWNCFPIYWVLGLFLRGKSGSEVRNEWSYTSCFPYNPSWRRQGHFSWIKRDQLDVTCFIISLFNAQHVSDVNTSILRSLLFICWVISWVVLHTDTTPPQPYYNVTPTNIEPEQYNPWNNSTNK